MLTFTSVQKFSHYIGITSKSKEKVQQNGECRKENDFKDGQRKMLIKLGKYLLIVQIQLNTIGKDDVNQHLKLRRHTKLSSSQNKQAKANDFSSTN